MTIKVRMGWEREQLVQIGYTRVYHGHLYVTIPLTQIARTALSMLFLGTTPPLVAGCCKTRGGVCPESGKSPKFGQNLNDFQQAKKFRRFAAKLRQNKGGVCPEGGFVPWNSIDSI